MKKVFSLSTVSVLVFSFITSTAMVASDPCQYISSASGPGGNYASPDRTLDAKLYFNPYHGDGVSGGFGSMINGKHYSAPLIDSHCKQGKITLRWNTPEFNGTVTGIVDVIQRAIVNLQGNINSQPVDNKLMFLGYQ